MDVDMLKSSSSSSSADDHHHQHHDQHMDMMEMMMHMQMHNNNPTFPEIDFTWGSNTTNNIEPISPLPMFHNPNLVSSQNSQHFNSCVSFIGNPVQDPKLIKNLTSSGLVSNPYSTSNATSYEKRNSMAAMREMIFRIAAMQPIHIDPESVKPPKRRNVKISKDPQSVAARHRRERISEKIRILQRLVPGGTKMDTASMLDEAIHYVKFLKKQVQTLEKVGADRPIGASFQGNGQFGNANYSALLRPSQLVGGVYADA